jgi:uncharacterized protein with ParB-like and HNH nuclease domain
VEAKARALTFLREEGRIKIPFFQRTYVWDDENWSGLLSELENSSRRHFLGSIILKQLHVQTGEPKQAEVVDGQQRLTTLGVLLKALYESFPDQTKTGFKGDIWPILFYRSDYTVENYQIKMEHSHVDAAAYEAVLNAGTAGSGSIDLQSVDENSHRILRCYRYFTDALQSRSEQARTSLLNSILAPENRMIVVIDLDEGQDDEQAIFDTLNTAGVRLSPAEVIKNALFQKVIQALGKDEKAREAAFKLYADTWRDSFLSDEETVKYWETERQTGRLKRDNIEILLHCIAVMKDFFDPDKDNLSDLTKVWKGEIQKRNTEKELREFVDEIVAYAKIYREKFPAVDRSTLVSFDDSITRLFHILGELEISTFHPFILSVFRNAKDEQESSSVLGNLEKLVVCRMVAHQETKNYNKWCKEFIRNRDSILDKLSETSDEDMSNGLRGISNWSAALLLFWVELSRRSRDKNYHDKVELNYAYSLEHIMPQKWEEYWKDIPQKHNSDGLAMGAEDAKKDRSEKVYWIGNMTLLKTALNTVLRNYPFDKKVNGEGRRKGMRVYASLSITQDDIIAAFDRGETTWNEKRIEDRTQKIEGEIRAIWRAA